MTDMGIRTKPIFPLLLSYALPMVISMLINSLYNIVDTFFVAKLGEDAVTALSLIFPLQNMIISISVGFGIGINAVISFCRGAKQEELAHTAATHGLVYACLHTILLTAMGILIMPTFLSWFTSSVGIQSLALTYGNIVFSFTFAVVIGVTFEKMFQAVGKMKATMVSLALGCITNIILDPLLIFGIGPFPKWGIAGAAIATGIGQVVSLGIYLWLFVMRPLPVQISKKYLKSNWQIDGKIYAVGIPATLNLALPSVFIGALNAMLAPFPGYIVILGIYYKLQTFLYLPANGIIQGLRPLIGYHYGAKLMRRVWLLYRCTLLCIGVMMLLGMLGTYAFAETLMGLFTTNLDTITDGAHALRMIAWGFVASAVSITTSGALEGLGKGGESLLIMTCRYVMGILPIAYGLLYAMGAAAVWQAFWLTEIAAALLSGAIMVHFFRTAP